MLYVFKVMDTLTFYSNLNIVIPDFCELGQSTNY